MSVALERLRLAGGRVPQGEVSEVALLLWLGHYEAALSCIGKDGMARRAVESLVKAMNSAQQASAVVSIKSTAVSDAGVCADVSSIGWFCSWLLCRWVIGRQSGCCALGWQR